MRQTKFIVFTGGVLSGLGKGVAAASIGKLLSQNLKIVPIKCDGYLNTDPGTMNPIEHGEVFVLDDGGEVDMDFGHYERFLNINCKSEWNLTMGKIFSMIMKKERKGDYLGKTVQFIPHVTDLIKQKIFEIAKKEKADIVLIEIGGTVGDIENQLFLEAVRQMKKDVNSDNILYIHLTYIPIPKNVNEQKSKPTQQSINLLRKIGIQPDIIIGRCEEILTDHIKEKIAIFGNIDKKDVITGLDVDNIYKIPLIFKEEGLLDRINKKFNLQINPDIKNWEHLLNNLENPDKEIKIAICGKYTRLGDSYASVIEALNHCSANFKCKINIRWVETTDIKDIEKKIKNVNGVIVPGGFGNRGIEGKIHVIKYCRENNIPFLGLCLGMQLAIIEFARNVCNLDNANTTEVNENIAHRVVDILPEQKNIHMKGATMRLGSQEAIVSGKIKEFYKTSRVFERHRHRYEVNPEYHEILQKNNLIISGFSSDKRLAEFIELPDHKFFVATQSHPELKSKLEKPSPLFYNFIKACLE